MMRLRRASVIAALSLLARAATILGVRQVVGLGLSVSWLSRPQPADG